MKKKIGFLIVFVFAVNMTFSQHLSFFGISMEGKIDDFHKVMLEKNWHCDDIYKDGSGDSQVYQYSGDLYGKCVSVFVRYSPLSKYVSSINCICPKDIYGQVMANLNESYGTQNYKQYKKEFLIEGQGKIVISPWGDKFMLKFYDEENDHLNLVESAPHLYSKRQLKKFQRKYGNCLFYKCRLFTR